MVHAFDSNGQKFALDVESLSLVEIDDLSYELLCEFPEDCPQEPIRLGGLYRC